MGEAGIWALRLCLGKIKENLSEFAEFGRAWPNFAKYGRIWGSGGGMMVKTDRQMDGKGGEISPFVKAYIIGSFRAAEKKTRLDTRLPKLRAGRQGPYRRSPDHLGRSSEVEEIKS